MRHAWQAAWAVRTWRSTLVCAGVLGLVAPRRAASSCAARDSGREGSRAARKVAQRRARHQRRQARQPRGTKAVDASARNLPAAQRGTAGAAPGVAPEAPREESRLEVRFEQVAWTPAVAGAGEAGRWTTKDVLESVSWRLQGSERVGLIGPNGCGKSTQLLMLQGLVQPTSGRVVKLPEDMEVAYMQQEAELDAEKSVLDELRSVFGDRPLGAIDADLERCAATGEASEEMAQYLDERAAVEEHQREVDALLPRLGMAAFREAPISELSGGWQMRTALGKIILGRPDLILLDEPTNHVDLETVEFMERFLRSQDVAMVIVSHDRYFLNQVCTKIVEIYRGQARSYRGDYVNYMRRRDASLAREWRNYQRFVDTVAILEKQVRRLQERFVLETAAQKRQELEKLLENPVPQPVVNEIRGFRFPCALDKSVDASGDASPAPVRDFWDEEDVAGPLHRGPESADAGPGTGDAPDAPLLVVEGLGVAYPDNVVLDGISFYVARGEKVALVGRNGCGKSTLVRAVVGDLGEGSSMRGCVEYTGAGLAYFPQRLAEYFNYESASVKDALYTCCGSREIEDAGGLEAVLQRLRLDGVTKDQPVCSLSGGEKARVAFAQFLLQPVALLVLDEPTNHLDILTRELLEDALKAFEGAALVVSHDRFFLREFATRVVEIVDGQLVNHASWDAYAAAAPVQWQAAEEAEVAFIKQDASAALMWSRKKLARLKKRKGGNVGLRRLSARVDEFMPEEEVWKSRADEREEKVVADLIRQGLDPALLGPHAPWLADRG